jgi:hypothetical protein
VVKLIESPDGLTSEEFAAEASRLAAVVKVAESDGDASAAKLLGAAAATFRDASAKAGPGTWAIDWDDVEVPR